MTRQVAPNGCLYCELPHNIHGSRLDGLHPRGVWTWVEPSDKLRLQRMKRNRMLRKEIAMMTEVPLTSLTSDRWVGTWVTYHGNRRLADLGNGRLFKVFEKRDDDKSVGFGSSETALEWAAPWSLHIASNPVVQDPSQTMTLKRAEDILNPHTRTIESLDAEIKRLRGRITELTAARQVIASL